MPDSYPKNNMRVNTIIFAGCDQQRIITVTGD